MFKSIALSLAVAAATPAFAAGFDTTTAPLPTDQRVLLASEVRAPQILSNVRAAAPAFDGISSVAALPTDQRVLATPSEQTASRQAAARISRADDVGVAKTYVVIAPLPTDQRI